MDAKKFFDVALDQATAVVMQVRDDDLNNPTPCTEWNVQSLCNHMLYELSWAADIAMGSTIDEVGSKYEGDLMTGVWQERWKDAAKEASQAIEGADDESIAHLSYGDVPLEKYLVELSNDLFIHAWDLGEAINQPVIFPETIIDKLYDYVTINQEELTESGLFGKPQEVPGDSDIQTKMLALYGRTANWRKTSD
jgi:uncharacterized protein (TIGR03086 family)